MKQGKHVYTAMVHLTPCSEGLKAFSSTITAIPTKYANYQDIFSKELVDELPERGSWDHEIDMGDSKVPYGPIYNLSERELKVIHA